MVKVQARSVKRKYSIVNIHGKKETLTVLNGLNLDINEGEFITLLGQSGCEKTTFLNLLAGLEKSDEGQILIDNYPLGERGYNRGVVFQNYALLPWRTVIKNLEIGLEIRGVKKKERREIARNYLKLINLSTFENQYPHQLSGGMKQRVAIARVLVYEPEIVLMDEPFAALDAQTRESLQIELLRIWEVNKKTIVFVTHSIDEAILLSDRIAFMSEGRIETIIEISIPRPRTKQMITSPEFLRIHKKIANLLQKDFLREQNYGAYI